MPEQRDHILQFFEFEHLPAPLQTISRPYCMMARRMCGEPVPEIWEDQVQPLPRNPERTVALRKLLECKDAAVRAFLAKE